MKLLRRFGFALWLALALVASQHAALLHDFGHASESLAQKHDGKPPQPNKCDKHYAFVQLAGAGGSGFAIPAVDCSVTQFLEPETGAPPARSLAYRSQAPPTLL
jgi:hypothetical protein